MSLIRISTILLVFISTQVICDAPHYCKDLTINGSFSGLQIYRYYGKDQKESIRLYNKDIEIVVELFSDMSLKFKERIKRNDTALHKFSAYVNKTKVFINCNVSLNEASEQVYSCIVPSGWGGNPTYKLDISRPLFVTPFKYSKHVLIVDQNDRNRYYAVHPQIYHYRWYGMQTYCNESSIECRKPTFLQQLNDYYFGKLEGVLDTTNGTQFGHLLLFLIDGRHRYCTTFEDKLSKECNSSANMKTLFSECFEVKDQSMDTLVWVFIVLVIIAVILIIADVMAYRRLKETKFSQLYHYLYSKISRN